MFPPRRLAGTAQASLLALILVAGCRSAVGVDASDPAATRTALDSNVVNSGRPSQAALMILRYFGLDRSFRRDPDASLVALHDIAASERLLGPYAVLAELHYERGLRTGRRGEFLAAALFAHQVFFDGELSGDLTPFSPYYQQTSEIYNRSLERVFAPSGEHLVLRDEEIETPLGPVRIKASRPGFPWGPEDFDDFLLADGFRIRGLRERVRISGLGAPVVALHTGEFRPGSLSTLSPVQTVTLPATAFLRVHGGSRALRDGAIDAQLELYLTLDQSEVEQDGRRVPLEADLTAPLALALEDSALWSFGLTGFFSGRTESYRTGITMLQPYQPGKVPLLLIHGTASSPVTFAQIINSLLADPSLRDRYQIWMSLYNTGNPILYSAAQQRRALSDLITQLDPLGRDPAMQHVVLVGHSQGGLIARLLVTSSGDRLWNELFEHPPGEVQGDSQDLAAMEDALIFEAVPQVDRVIFISTPHGGSFVAGGWLGRFASDLVSVPGDLVDSVRNVASQALLAKQGDAKALDDLPTSVDNMKPGSRFLTYLDLLEFQPNTHLHSIIAGPTPNSLRGSNDNVVNYESAHLEQAESELVYQGTHTDQNSPPVVAELRRILREHLEDIPAPREGALPIP